MAEGVVHYAISHIVLNCNKTLTYLFILWGLA